MAALRSAAATAGGLAGLVATVKAAGAEKDKEKLSTGFDPEALERGAKALREINDSQHARKVIELSKQQESTKQQESAQKEAEANQQAQQFKVEQERVHWDEMRKTNQQQSEQRAQLAKQEDELARKRQQDEAEAQRSRNAEFVKMQEESAERQEAMRRQTDEKKQREQRETARIQAEAEREKVRAQALAEAEGRTREARENEDVQRRQLRERMQQETERAKQVVQTTLDGIGSGFRSLLEDRTRMASLAAGAAMLGAGVYGTREGAKVGARFLERVLSQPQLVRDSSRRRSLLSLVQGGKTASEASGSHGKILGDVVLEDFVQERLEQLASAARRARSRRAPMRNMLLYGPPGTGKTMVARRLAKHAGMEYAVVNGGDVAPLGSAASPKLHELFDWAERSSTGTVLFIDEADAFLSRRGSAESDASRSAVNTLLARTGSQGRNVMLVLATNRPFDLDSAIVDRMDDAMEIELPGQNEREYLLSLYFRKYIEGQHELAESDEAIDQQRGGLFGRRAQPPPAIENVDVNEADIKELAQKTQGFSGREIAKLVGAMQAAAFGSEDGRMTKDLFWSIGNLKLSEHNMRDTIVFEGKSSSDRDTIAPAAAT